MISWMYRSTSTPAPLEFGAADDARNSWMRRCARGFSSSSLLCRLFVIHPFIPLLYLINFLLNITQKKQNTNDVCSPSVNLCMSGNFKKHDSVFHLRLISFHSTRTFKLWISITNIRDDEGSTAPRESAPERGCRNRLKRREAARKWRAFTNPPNTDLI